MTEVILLRPWLLLLVLPLLAALLWKVANDRTVGAWNAAIDAHLMEAMAGLGKITQQGQSQIWRNLLIWSLILAVPALVGPAFSTRDASAFRNLDGVVLVMDVSPSVAETDALPQLALAARSALQSIGSRPAALIVYAGDAYVASEFTTDTDQIEFTLQLLDKDTIPDKGSRPSLALEAAARLITEAEILRSDIVWLTDGGGLTDEQISKVDEVLAGLETRLTIIAADSEHGERMGGWARANETQHFRPLQIDEISNHLASTTGQTLALSDLRLLTHRDIGPLLLLPAALLMLLWFRRTE